MEKFTHLQPEEVNAELPNMHELQLTVDGEEVGIAYLNYYSKPVPLYLVSQLWINEGERNNKYGTKIMEQVERMLKEKGKAGILREGIDEYKDNDPKARGMYARRGWQPIPDVEKGRWHVYNLPEGVTPEEMTDFIKRWKSVPRRERRAQRYSKAVAQTPIKEEIDSDSGDSLI